MLNKTGDCAGGWAVSSSFTILFSCKTLTCFDLSWRCGDVIHYDNLLNEPCLGLKARGQPVRTARLWPRQMFEVVTRTRLEPALDPLSTAMATLVQLVGETVMAGQHGPDFRGCTSVPLKKTVCFRRFDHDKSKAWSHEHIRPVAHQQRCEHYRRSEPGRPQRILSFCFYTWSSCNGSCSACIAQEHWSKTGAIPVEDQALRCRSRVVAHDCVWSSRAHSRVLERSCDWKYLHTCLFLPMCKHQCARRLT